jgi:hypothetical protein
MPVYPPQCSYMPVTGGSAALVAVLHWWQCGSVEVCSIQGHAVMTARLPTLSVTGMHCTCRRAMQLRSIQGHVARMPVTCTEEGNRGM